MKHLFTHTLLIYLGLISRQIYAQETLYDSDWHQGKAYMRDGSLRTGLFSVQLLRSEDRDNDGNSSVTETYVLRQRVIDRTRMGNEQPTYTSQLIKQKTVDRLVFQAGYELRRVGTTLARVVLKTPQLTLLEDHPGFNQRIYPGLITNYLIVSDGLTVTHLSKSKHYSAWLRKQASQAGTGTGLNADPTALDVLRAVLNTRATPTTDTLLFRDGKRLLGQILTLTTEQVSYRTTGQAMAKLSVADLRELHFQQGGVLCLPNPTELEELAVQAAKQTVPTQEDILREDCRIGIHIFWGYGTSANVGLSPFRVQGFGNFGVQKQFFWPLSNRLLPVVGLQLLNLPYRQDPTFVSDMMSKGFYLGLIYRLSNKPLPPELNARRYWWISPRVGAYQTTQTYQNAAFLPIEDGGLPGVTKWLVSPGVAVGYRLGAVRVGLAYNYLPARPIQGLSYQSNYYDVTFFKEPQHHLALQLSLGF